MPICETSVLKYTIGWILSDTFQLFLGAWCCMLIKAPIVEEKEGKNNHPQGEKINHTQGKTTQLFFFFGCSHLGLNIFRNNESHSKNILFFLLNPQHVGAQATCSALILIFVGIVCGWIICSPDVATTGKSLSAYTRGWQIALLQNPKQPSRLRFPFSTESFQNNHRQINFVQMLSVSWLKKIILRKTKSVSLTPSSSLSICTNSNIIKNASKEPYNLKC